MDDKQILSPAEKVELMSEEAQEIVGRVPPWIVRWGITVVFCIVVGFLAGSWWIRYPDETVAVAEVCFENQPLEVRAPFSGWVSRIVASEGAKVIVGDTLLMMVPDSSGTKRIPAIAYAVMAESEGVLSQAGGWSVHQPITSGSLLCTIIPEVLGTPWVKVSLPVEEAGRVQLGQRVLVRLELFPSAEYGVLEGRLETVSWTSVSESGRVFYPARVVLNQGLVTQFNIPITPSIALRGTAHILGKERSLMDRMIQSFYYDKKK